MSHRHGGGRLAGHNQRQHDPWATGGFQDRAWKPRRPHARGHSTTTRRVVMRSGPRRWFRFYLGSAWMGPGVGWSNCGGRRGREGPPSAMLSGPLGPLRGTCHATPRDLRRALGPVPCGAHPRPAVTELQSRRGASAARGSASPTRGSPLPCLSATQPHPDIPTIRLPWSSRSFPCLPPRHEQTRGPVRSDPEPRRAGTPVPAGPAPAEGRGRRSPCS